MSANTSAHINVSTWLVRRNAAFSQSCCGADSGAYSAVKGSTANDPSDIAASPPQDRREQTQTRTTRRAKRELCVCSRGIGSRGLGDALLLQQGQHALREPVSLLQMRVARQDELVEAQRVA